MIRFARQLALTLAALTLAVLVSFNQDPPEEVRPPEESAQPASSTEAAATQPAPQGDPAQPRERDGRGGGSRDQGLAAFAQQYGSLMQINIFLRDRRVRRETSQQQVSRQQAPPPRPETEWVLSGVVYEEGAFRAYFENVRSGEVISELIWKRTATGWRIVSERDLRVVR